MSKLIVEGKDLTVVKNVVKAMGDYKVTELISNEEIERNTPKVIKDTCSACPYFTELVDERGMTRVKWGRCSKYGDCAVNREHDFCRAYKEEINYRRELVSTVDICMEA